MESNMMPLIQSRIILKFFENHKLRYMMKYGFFYKLEKNKNTLKKKTNELKLEKDRKELQRLMCNNEKEKVMRL
jgi:hypothetical protein